MRSHNYRRSLDYHVCLVRMLPDMSILSLSLIKMSTNIVLLSTTKFKFGLWWNYLGWKDILVLIIISSVELVIYVNTLQYYATLIL